MGVPDGIATPNLPSLSPFPDFRFGGPITIDAPDLGIHPRGPPRPANAARIELKAGGELQHLRDEMARQARAIPDKLTELAKEEPLKIATVQFPAPIAEQAILDVPQMTTTTQYLYP
jgi:hypothetical protein